MQERKSGQHIRETRDLLYITYLTKEKKRDPGSGSEILRRMQERKSGQHIRGDDGKPKNEMQSAAWRLRRGGVMAVLGGDLKTECPDPPGFL